MSAERYYYPQLLQEGGVIFLEDQEFHHMYHVMRASAGDKIELVNGQGQLALGVVTKIEKKRATISIEKVHTEPPPSVPMIVAQAIPRTSRLEFVLEKGTELGMTEVWLFSSARSEKRNFSPHQIVRFEGILIAALKQCDRLYLPKLVLMPEMKQWNHIAMACYFGDVSPSAPLLSHVWQTRSHTEGSLFCVGPESGFTSQEEVFLKEKGFIGVKLHKNILRTDTAGIVALSIMSQF